MAENPETTVQTTGDPAPAGNPAQNEKTFTQAELDAIVGKRVAKAVKGMPDETELAAFRAWKDSQQTEQQRWDALTKERDTAKSDLAAAQSKVEQYERERYLLSKGIPVDDVDYYAFKAGKLVTDDVTFEMAVDEIIKSKTIQDQGKGTPTARVDFGAPLTGGKADMTVDEIMAVQDDAKRQALILQHHKLFGF